jgi:hypothetical protein
VPSCDFWIGVHPCRGANDAADWHHRRGWGRAAGRTKGFDVLQANEAFTLRVKSANPYQQSGFWGDLLLVDMMWDEKEH